MRRGEQTVLEIDGGGISLVRVSRAGSGLEIGGVERFEAPESVDPSDHEAFDGWAVERIRERGVRGRLVAVVTRGDVVLKVLSLPGAQSLEEGDLARPVRLQMERQTVSVERPVVDYVRLEDEGPGERSEARVLAAALAAAHVERLGEVARRAGARLSAIGLRSIGAAAMLREAIGREHEVVLGIALGPASAEIVVLQRGRLVFARMVEAQGGEGGGFEEVAEAIGVEAKRTWMSYRSLRDSADVDLVAVLGDGPEAERLAEVCAGSLGLEGRVSGLAEGVHFGEGAAGASRLHAATLAGPVFAHARGEPALDFANPRRPIDRGAAARRRVLAGALAVILLAGTGYLAASGRVAALERRVEAVRTEWSEAALDHMSMLRREARVEHLERWTAQQADWLAHLDHIVRLMPPRSEAYLDVAEGAQSGVIGFSSDRGRYSGGRWSERLEVSIRMEGRARDREVANALRARLIADEGYRVRSRGPDSPTSFAFELVSEAASPEGLSGGEGEG